MLLGVSDNSVLYARGAIDYSTGGNYFYDEHSEGSLLYLSPLVLDQEDSWGVGTGTGPSFRTPAAIFSSASPARLLKVSRSVYVEQIGTRIERQMLTRLKLTSLSNCSAALPRKVLP